MRKAYSQIAVAMSLAIVGYIVAVICENKVGTKPELFLGYLFVCLIPTWWWCRNCGWHDISFAEYFCLALLCVAGPDALRSFGLSSAISDAILLTLGGWAIARMGELLRQRHLCPRRDGGRAGHVEEEV